MDKSMITIRLNQLADSVQDRNDEMDQFKAAFEEVRPRIEGRAAAGDKKAIALLAKCRAMLAAELGFAPVPGREEYVSLEWLLPPGSDEDGATEKR